MIVVPMTAGETPVMSDLEALLGEQITAVRALTQLGSRRATTVNQLANVDDAIATAAADAADLGLTWRQINQALAANVQDPAHLPTESQVYSRARTKHPAHHAQELAL